MAKPNSRSNKKASRIFTTKFIFVAGGVMSGVGKGIASASIGKILQARGYEVTAVKIDPYVNVDAGTMSPTEHGEVFVLDDGAECDQDMGNYERFLDRDLTIANYMTTGSIYLSVIQKERALEYNGKQVEVVPRIPLEVIDRIQKAAKKNQAEIVIIEIGGTVGEYENLLFLEAVRMLKIKNHNDVAVVLVSFVPALGAGGTELKTKPTQHAVRSLNAVGIQPDVVLARAKIPLDKQRKDKIEFMCSVEAHGIISAPDVDNIYEVPLNFEKDGLGNFLIDKLGLPQREYDLGKWKAMVNSMKNAKKVIKIGIVGKYFSTGDFVLSDSYLSVIEAVKHAAWSLNRKPEIVWLNAETYEKTPASLEELKQFDGIIIPGGFGSRGVEGKILAINYVRNNNIPFLGLCYGLQLAVIEFARDVCGIEDAHTTEVDPKTSNPIISTMAEQEINIKEKKMGGSMRLGAYQCRLVKNSKSRGLYRKDIISERHRHRYEVNNDYRKILEEKGLLVAGVNPQRNLIEIIELPNHKFFVASQFHPEFKSRPLSPHPLFVGLIKSAII